MYRSLTLVPVALLAACGGPTSHYRTALVLPARFDDASPRALTQDVLSPLGFQLVEAPDGELRAVRARDGVTETVRVTARHDFYQVGSHGPPSLREHLLLATRPAVQYTVIASALRDNGTLAMASAEARAAARAVAHALEGPWVPAWPVEQRVAPGYTRSARVAGLNVDRIEQDLFRALQDLGYATVWPSQRQLLAWRPEARGGAVVLSLEWIVENGGLLRLYDVTVSAPDAREDVDRVVQVLRGERSVAAR